MLVRRLKDRPFLKGMTLFLALWCLPNGLRAESDPVARIRSIIVGGEIRTEAQESELKIVSADLSTTRSGSISMPLYADDQVGTGSDTRVVIFYLDDVAETDKEVIIYPESLVRITDSRSIFLKVGRVFAWLRGLFAVETEDFVLAAEGTELEVRALEEGGFEVLALQGDLDVEPGGRRSEPIGSGMQTEGTPPSGGRQIRYVVSDSPVRIRKDTKLQVERELAIENACLLRHQFEVRDPLSLPWARLAASSKRANINAGERGTFRFQLEVDTGGVAPGSHVANLIVNCVSCPGTEPECTPDAFVWPIEVTVFSPVRVEALQKLSLGSVEPQEPQVDPASEERVRSTLGWTNEVILAVEPDYTPDSSEPNFSSSQERRLAFVNNRFDAIWRRQPDAYFSLGDAFADWGEGTRAFSAYEHGLKLATGPVESARLLANVGEAARQIGELDQAESFLREALQKEPDSSRVLNAFGNLMLDKAVIARDQEEERNAEVLMEQASAYYDNAVRNSVDSWQKAVALTNRGKVQRALGELAEAQGNLGGATAYLTRAAEDLKAAGELKPDFTGVALQLGSIYQAFARVARSSGASADAEELFLQAENQYRSVLEKHPAHAGAYLQLGTLFEERGGEYVDSAAQNYDQAIQVRPKYAPAYYQLGALLEKESVDPGKLKREEDPRQYYSSYLQLEPEAFKKGTRAQSAELGKGNLIPDLRGLQLEAARVKLVESGFVVGTTVRQPSSFKAGTVVSQSPEAGSRLPRGTSVNLVVAAPREAGPIPKVKGYTEIEARNRIASAGFEVGRISLKESGKPPGTVLEQSPAGGKKLGPGTRVDLVLAEPRKVYVRVPNLMGDSQARAQGQIQRKKLTVGEIREQPSCEASGEVIAQDPPKGERVLAGSPVNLVVSGPGENPGRVPRLVGLDRDSALRALEDSGLAVGRTRDRETEESPPDTVLEQEPEPGVLLARGCPIDLLVAKAVPMMETPRLVGRPLEEVQNELRSWRSIFAGFKLGSVVYRESGEPPGTIIDQNPGPGAPVRRGAAIDVVVAKSRGATESRDVVVPALVGMNLRAAYRVFEEFRGQLRLGRQTSEASDQPQGTIIRQKPEAGMRVPVGTLVHVVVAEPAERTLVVVPDVRGQSYSNALRVLAGAGLKGVAANRGEYVREQDPKPGARVERGTRVTLYLVIGDD